MVQFYILYCIFVVTRARSQRASGHTKMIDSPSVLKKDPGEEFFLLLERERAKACWREEMFTSSGE